MLSRFARENKKLLADSLRLERENDLLAQQLLTKQIGMRAGDGPEVMYTRHEMGNTVHTAQCSVKYAIVPAVN